MRVIPFAAAALAAALATPAAAAIVINVGPGALQPDENLLFTNDPPPGLTIEGVTNQTDTLVSIFGAEALVGTGGQARIDTLDGNINTVFTFRGLANQRLGFD